MYFSKFKNFIITFLIFLAIYQTTGLWFENFSTHSLFSLIKSKSDNTNIQKNTSYLVESIIINTGNNKFIRKYNNISNSSYKKIFDETIYLCIKNGDFYPKENFDIKEILDNRSIIYTYNFDINGKDIQKLFNVKNIISSNIELFDTISIIPITDDKYDVKVIFSSSKSQNYYEFSLVNDNLGQNISNIINEFNDIENKNFNFISTEKSGISLFKTNQFLPKAKDEIFDLNKIYSINPLEQDGGILLSESEKYVDIFFENPINKSSSFINNTYTYNDENVIVKYYPEGVLEYVKYKSNMGLEKQNSPYNIAIQFLNKDSNIKNEYYLKDYKIEQNKTIFYFDYKINNFPIILSDNKKQQTNMQSMIEVTVENNIVSKYKRLIYDFYLDDEYTKVEKSFIEAIDKFLLNINKKDIKIDNMKLAYKFDNINDLISINWVITLDRNNYFENVMYGG